MFSPMHYHKQMNNRRYSFPAWIPFLLLWLVSCLTFTLGVKKVGFAIWGDTHYYYAYTRSIVIDHDINFDNEAHQPKYPFPNPPVVIKATGLISNNFSPGIALVWIPGFVIGEAASRFAQVLSFPITTDGYSVLTQLIVAYTAVGCSVVGLALNWLSLKKLFTKKIAWLTVGVLFLTSQLLYYTMLDPLNSHSGEFLFASIVLWMCVQLWKNHTQRWWFLGLLGAVGGFLGLIRNQDLLTIIPVAGLVACTATNWQDRSWKITLLMAKAAAVLLIQVWFTWILYHQFGSPYEITGQHLHWLQPDFLRVLFSEGNGFFRFAPIAVLALAGLWSWRKQELVLATVGLGVFLLQLYVVASWGLEIIGGPYGSRMFIGTLPFLALGLAHVMTSMQKKLAALSLLTLLLTSWNVFQILWMLKHS